MNPFFLLLGFFGFGAMGSIRSEAFETTTPGAETPDTSPRDDNGKTPATDGGGIVTGDVVTDDDMGGGDDDGQGGMDMGGGDDDGQGGMDMGGGDDDGQGGMDMGGGDDDDQGGMDMGGGDDDDQGGMDMGGGDDDDHGGMDHGHGGGSSHGDQSTPTIAPPGDGASSADINAYVAAIRAQGEAHPHAHDHDAGMMNEHMAAMDLVDRADATHIAVRDGQWDDPNTWHNGEVPGDGARALVPEGIEVDYSTVSDASLFTVRVDGVLDFATDTDSQMIFDTMIVSPTGHLVIGTEGNPVNPNVNVDLIVANNGPIDTNWDPMLLSRGLISHGSTSIHGAEKDSHEKVSEDPMAGDNSVAFDTIPTGWQVGDTIVVAGTSYSGGESQDEVREITSIEGNRVYFENPLAYNHDAPRDDLSTSVANYTRNVSIESEDGAASEVYERGHVMFMHSDDVDVRYAEFTELGRTDKSFESRGVDDFGSTNFDTNVQGRYSLHIHRAGTEDLNDPAIFEGNAVFGSPGWGVVHHDSNADLTNNATFDTFGSGFVAETGNETGTWHDNIAIFAEGTAFGSVPKNTSQIGDNFDVGRGGEGFWFQGRLIEATDNVAASVNVGYAFFHRDSDDGDMIDADAANFAYGDALYGRGSVDPDKPAILGFEGNEAFAAHTGLHVTKASTLQGHDVWTHLEDFTAWDVRIGAFLEYTAHYHLQDFDLIGGDGARQGIFLETNVSEIVITGADIAGFEAGIDLNKEFTAGFPDSLHQYVVIDANVADNIEPIRNYDPSVDIVTTSDQLPNYAPDLELNPMSYEMNGWIRIEGTKTDSVGVVDFPGGVEEMDIPPWHAGEVINNYGYYTTSDGQDYMLLDVYFTDRGTGQVYYETHPVMLNGVGFGTGVDGGYWLNTPFNGVQDIVTENNVTMAGDRVLYEAIEAVPYAHLSSSQTLSSMPDSHDMHDMSADTEMAAMDMADTAAMTEATWLNGYDGDGASMVINDGLFVNVGDVSDLDLIASGGETVLATGGAEFELSSSRTLAVMEAAAEVGFDGTDGGMAILDMEEGSTVAFASNDGGLGTIGEFDSSGFEGETDVLSGIDLGGATLAVNLSGLSEDAGTSFTLMSADEIVGLFEDTEIDGLGARDARIVIDYENDSVSLELSEGEGAVTVETAGTEETVTAGEEALWNALTAGQGIVSDAPALPEDDDLLDEVA